MGVNMSEQQERDYTTVSIPNDLMRKVDSALKEGGYQNRSDFIRAAIRSLLEIQNCKQET
jgi:metal-responsive CopG/Arc/MetJ family transcriptional regulator